jgi:hypothetical protein
LLKLSVFPNLLLVWSFSFFCNQICPLFLLGGSWFAALGKMCFSSKTILLFSVMQLFKNYLLNKSGILGFSHL